MWKRMAIAIVVLGAVFGGTFYFLGVVRPQMMAQYFASMKPPPVVVSATEVSTAQWQPFVESVGTVKAEHEVELTTEVPGVIRTIRFESGQRVRAGEVLVELDTTEDEAVLRGLEAALDLARANYERDLQLRERKVASSLDFETSRANLASAEANVAAQKARIAKKTLRAPFDGEIGIRKVSPGQYLQPGTPIATLLGRETVYVDFSVPEHWAGRIHPGLAVEARMAALPDQVFRGQVSALDARISDASRNLKVRATFTNAELKLVPGMFATLKVLVGEPENVVVVPQTAVETHLYGNVAFVVQKPAGEGEPPTVERRYVKTGAVQAGMIRILDGLRPGETVVTAGQLKLQNGTPVKIDNSVSLATGGQ